MVTRTFLVKVNKKRNSSFITLNHYTDQFKVKRCFIEVSSRLTLSIAVDLFPLARLLGSTQNTFRVVPRGEPTCFLLGSQDLVLTGPRQGEDASRLQDND